MSLSLKATQADGYYQPPEFDAKRHGTLNKINKTHRLGKRGAKIKQGIVTVRFEMPFKLWCLGCEQILAKGVRVDAEKKTVGQFHSTPILEFSFTCIHCHHPLRIRTDPENTEYVCHEGCRPRIETFDPDSIGGWKFRSVEELKEIEANPLLQTEARVLDARKTRDETSRLNSIIEINNDHWQNDTDRNAELRAQHRKGRGKPVERGNRNFILPELPLSDKEMAEAGKIRSRTRGGSQLTSLKKLMRKAAKTSTESGATGGGRIPR